MGIKSSLRNIVSLVWLSYKIEANWTNMPSYLAYITIRPTFTLLLMVFIFVAVRGNQQFGYFILVGQAFYNLVGSGIIGIANTLWEDREHYKMLKYMYLLPIKFPIYLLGRGLYKYIEGIIPLIISFLVGAAIVGIPLNELNVNWPLLILNYFLGYVWITAFGFLIASLMFFTTEYGWIVIESIMGSLLLFGNVIFPSNILPFPFNIISNGLPIKSWIDLNREIIAGQLSYFNFQFMIFVIICFSYLIVSLLIFQISEKQAKKRGLIDIVTTH